VARAHPRRVVVIVSGYVVGHMQFWQQVAVAFKGLG
jgi:hypothetical protein